MIDWTKQHCGVHQAEFVQLLVLMPDLTELLATFPDDPRDFTWDVKVHMLMPGQYPCVPNWHFDNIPRGEDGKQDYNKVQLDKPMYLWLSGAPFTEFKFGSPKFVEPQQWVKFYQNEEHRGTVSEAFQWRGFIRATHKDILKPKKGNVLRRHCQVYLDAENFKW